MLCTISTHHQHSSSSYLQDELALSVTMEQGKTLPDAKGDVFRGLEVVEAACGMAPFLAGEMLEGVASGIDCYTIRQPRGVRVRDPAWGQVDGWDDVDRNSTKMG